ncbi:hypothetical protein KC669_00760 [Candidatus Dojkabacteria bacterium]|uniref:Uncharacterized protein n=1 Tax=Candidatus Dojkabacteria bacterium TaxID=2099670 RepID=A0A955LA82_9BACT|nr:hypothetical protein [Candidatus Dojkabacteria bacterium]
MNPTTNESSIVNKAIGMISIFSVVSIAVSIYFVYQKSTARKGLITVGQITAFIIAGVIVSTLLQLTYLSIVSRVYQLTELDILTIVVAGIWTSIIASFAYIQQRYSSQNSLRSFIKELKTKVLMLRHYKLSVVLFLIIPMFIGLGTQFVIPGILLAGALLSPLASFLTLLRIYERILEKRKSNASSPNKELPTFHSNASSSKKGKVKNKPWQKRFKKKRKQ